MDTKFQQRLECAWLLRDAAWSLKRTADRYEKAAMQPTPQNEAKAAQWHDTAKRRLAKFSAARRKYLGVIEPIDQLSLDLCVTFPKPLELIVATEPAAHVEISGIGYFDRVMSSTVLSDGRWDDRRQPRRGNPWRAGPPPVDYIGEIRIFHPWSKIAHSGPNSHLTSGARKLVHAWRPA